MLQKYLSRSVLLLALTLSIACQAKEKCRHPVIEASKLSLTAQATIHKPADELQMKIGVVTIADDAETALSENSNKMQAVIDSLLASGLTREEYETGHFSIHPTYTPYPQNPPADWKATINGYEVSNALTIHTDKMDMAGKFIDASNKAGANSVSNISFSLHDPRIYWKDALAAATTNAMEDAQAIALTAGVQLGRVISINLNHTTVAAHHLDGNYVAKAMMAGGAMPSIEPGDVKIDASISIVYEIKN